MLDRNALIRILTEPKSAIVKQYQKMLELDGVELTFDRDALEAIADISLKRKTGDQPQAIEALVKGFKEGNQCQTLLGVTGSGKTFTMANVIQALNKPTLVIAHNKTLAAQLYGEFKEMFPDNAVEYFVSYYDYYQPEHAPPSRTYCLWFPQDPLLPFQGLTDLHAGPTPLPSASPALSPAVFHLNQKTGHPVLLLPNSFFCYLLQVCGFFRPVFLPLSSQPFLIII